MNKFRRTKKVKEPVEPEAAPTAPMGFMGTTKFKKNKAIDVPVMPALDLENALPSSDNFRTSLLMPNLSARFSMLREQDDPTSKLGKANDDSVLFPKRQSRLNLFGHSPNPLTDIAEVASIGGRSSFNMGRTDSTVDEMGRTYSYASAGDFTDDFTDDSSTHGGVMNRKRPGEGNNLFGGRQKVYKIPISSSGKDIGSKGKSVYEDDIHLSAFQKMRQREKEERARMGLTLDEVHDLSTPEYEDGCSFLAKRTTSSSTTSGHSNPRTSTAATSIDEQPISNNQANGVPPSPTKKSSWVPPAMMGHVSKTRRLYGQNQEQPPSPFNRFESLSRQNSGAGTPERPRLTRTFSRSASNLSERHQRLSPANPPSAGSRTYSPTISANSPQLDTADAQQQDRTSGSSSISPSGYGIVPPLSPPVSDNEEMSALNAHLQPEDRGKATAMGLFNKPSGPFDEQQFMRRQLQMHEGRNTPPVMTRQSPSNSVSNGVPRPEPVRSRGLSNASYRSKAESASSRYSDDVPGSRAHSVRDYSPPRNGTFMLNLDASDSEGHAGDEQSLKKVSSVKSQAFDGIHPAFRSRPTSRDSDVAYPPHESFDFPEVKYPDRDLNPIQENHASPPSPILEEASERAQDSPTLGPTGLGLSSMIRTHLRHDSTQSSIYPIPPSPRASVHQDVAPLSLDTNLVKESPAESHPEELVSPKTDMKPPSYPPPEPPTSGFSNVALRAKQLRDQAAALREQTNQPRDSSESDRLTEMPPSSQPDLNFGHRRGSSTETQKEREEFANELAERRRRVQENLHRIGSRSNSPASGRQTPDVASGRTGNTFSALKNRAGKSSPPDRSIPATRALKKLGIGSASMNSSTPSLDCWREDEPSSHGLGKHSNSSSPQISSGRQRPFRGAPSRSTSYGSQEDLDPVPSRTASPSRQSRDRSTSASGRSKSHARPRDDLGMVAEDPYPPSRGSPIVPSSARPSVDNDDGYARERPGSGGLSRSSSKALAPGQVDLPDPQPRPSPMAAYSANATPPLEGPESGHMPYMLQPGSPYNSNNMPQRSPTSNSLPKRQVDKSQISEPTFVSSTSNVPMVDLAAAASITNAMDMPPAVPPMNPRRKRTGTGTGSMHRPQTASARSSQDERRTMTSFDDERRQLAHQRLRKMSSEGSSLHGRSRPETANYPPPPTTSVEGGMI